MNNSNILEEHSLRFLEMAFCSDKQGGIPNPDGYGQNTRACGDTIEIFLLIQEDKIGKISYTAKGCMNTNACTNALICLAEGKSIEEAWQITPQNLADDLQTLPQDHFHSAQLVIGAFRAALTNCSELRQKPWKKSYIGKSII